MIYQLHLFVVGALVGAALIALHALALSNATSCRKWLNTFPRSRTAGTVLVAIAGIWSFLLVAQMDLGEFAPMRKIMLIGSIAGAVLAWKYVEEFLAVRALGMVLLLLAEPLLEATFLHPQPTRLLLVVLAYVWIVAGLFWVGMPWLLRDQIKWVTAQPLRFRAAAMGGVVYGAAILVCAILFWR